MNINGKRFITVCTLTIFSFISFKVQAQGMESSVCHNPIQRICIDTASQRSARAFYVNNLKAEISREAEINSIPKIAEMKKKVKAFHFIRRHNQKLKIRNQEIVEAAKRRIVGFESVVMNEDNISKLKNYMNQAIDNTHFASEIKKDFKGIIKSVVIGNFNDFIERLNIDDNTLYRILNSACGVDGLVDNAFATKIGNVPYVLICPGFLITLNQTPNASDRFNSMLQAVAHEMGHHIDLNNYSKNEMYVPFLSCISRKYSNYFNKTVEDQKFCQKYADNPEYCSRKVTLSHAGELVADQWGIAVTALHAKAESYSVAETDQMLTDSWAKLCDSGDEGVHPSGNFRIGAMMRKNPDISNYLSCLPSEVKTTATCTFDGEVAN
jgi:hypothetical protein